jgi:hypothetical protein
VFRIEMLDAYEGDALWIEFGQDDATRRIVIDAGRKETYRDLVDRIKAAGGPIDLFVMTHVDDDHIFGAIPLLGDARVNQETFRDIWYNGFTHLDPDVARRPPADLLGPRNGEVFAALLLDGHHPWNEAFDGGATVVIPDGAALPTKDVAGMKITLLSPTWTELERMKSFWEEELEDMEPNDPAAALALFSERSDLQPDVLGTLVDVEELLEHEYESDSKEPNGSSIAFLAEYDGHAVLFAGDAHPTVLERSVARLLHDRGEPRLRLDAFKVSHHGSKNNTSVALLDLLDCRRYLISTNGSRHHHPDQEAIARIVHRNHAEPVPTELYFNHRTEWNKVWDDDDLKDDWHYLTFYPPKGQTLVL